MNPKRIEKPRTREKTGHLKSWDIEGKEEADLFEFYKTIKNPIQLAKKMNELYKGKIFDNVPFTPENIKSKLQEIRAKHRDLFPNIKKKK